MKLNSVKYVHLQVRAAIARWYQVIGPGVVATRKEFIPDDTGLFATNKYSHGVVLIVWSCFRVIRRSSILSSLVWSFS